LKTPLGTWGGTKLLKLKRNLQRGTSIGECLMFQKFENGPINMDPKKNIKKKEKEEKEVVNASMN
jgi:hypothetical protein